MGYWDWGRPSPYQLWEDLQGLFRRTTADFDSSTAEARAVWAAPDGAEPPRRHRTKTTAERAGTGAGERVPDAVARISPRRTVVRGAYRTP